MGLPPSRGPSRRSPIRRLPRSSRGGSNTLSVKTVHHLITVSPSCSGTGPAPLLAAASRRRGQSRQGSAAPAGRARPTSAGATATPGIAVAEPRFAGSVVGLDQIVRPGEAAQVGLDRARPMHCRPARRRRRRRRTSRRCTSRPRRRRRGAATASAPRHPRAAPGRGAGRVAFHSVSVRSTAARA